MVPAFATGFLELIESELDSTSTGVASPHHLHNIQSAIAQILSLVQHGEQIEAAADSLARRAADYVNRHDLACAADTDVEWLADARRFEAAQAALASFREALEHSQPNARVRTLGLG